MLLVATSSDPRIDEFDGICGGGGVVADMSARVDEWQHRAPVTTPGFFSIGISEDQRKAVAVTQTSAHATGKK